MDHARRVTDRRDPADLAAQVARLQQRLRQGELTPPRLRLAAWADDPAARAALGCEAPAPFERLPADDRWACLAVAAAAARVACETPAPESAAHDAYGLRSLENWLDERIGLPELLEVGVSLALTEDTRYYLLNPRERDSLRSAFRREVAAPNPHPVRDLLPFAHAWAGDDLVGVVTEGRGAPRAVCEVHLTRTRTPPEAPGFPGHMLYADVRAWLEALWRDDPEPSPSLAYASGVVPLALCPATLEVAPWFNAEAALACLELTLGAEVARSRVAPLVQARALPGAP